ncbi:hypothetical protein ACQ9LF_06165 [Anaerohalosphaeraceae bacterium U12dextr]|jgi:hypothetical protein
MMKDTQYTVQDAVCPECFKLLIRPLMHTEDLSGDGVTRRGYSGWCTGCDKSYVVIQRLLDDGRWRIQKYAAMKPVYVIDGDWKIIEQPDGTEAVPLIQTGPGGDYYRSVSGEAINQTAAQAKEVLIKCVNLIGEVNDTLKQLVRIAGR